ncbi:hypothetical protein JCM14469_41460 [Desulfatiferula olefinivorans]
MNFAETAGTGWHPLRNTATADLEMADTGADPRGRLSNNTLIRSAQRILEGRPSKENPYLSRSHRHDIMPHGVWPKSEEVPLIRKHQDSA